MTIGSTLRAAREQLGMSLEQVHHQTRISLEILQAIEADRLEGMSPVYLRGFIKRYAECVRVDPRELLSGLGGVTRPAVSTPVTHPLESPPPPLPSWVTQLGAASAGALVASGLVWAAAQWWVEAHQPKMARAPIAKSRPPRPAAIASAKPIMPVSAIEPRSAIQSAAPVVAASSKPFRLEIQAKEAAWLVVRVDGQVLFQGILPAGSREAWQATAEARLDVNPAEAVELSVSGRSMGSPGKGFVKEFVVKSP